MVFVCYVFSIYSYFTLLKLFDHGKLIQCCIFYLFKFRHINIRHIYIQQLGLSDNNTIKDITYKAKKKNTKSKNLFLRGTSYLYIILCYTSVGLLLWFQNQKPEVPIRL